MDDDENRKIYEEVDNRELELDHELPLLPIRNPVLFPGAVAPFDVGREKSVAWSRTWKASRSRPS